jgi:hypothetical protein
VEFVVHCHRERNHQGLANQLIDGVENSHQSGPVRSTHRWSSQLLLPCGVAAIRARNRSAELSDTTRTRFSIGTVRTHCMPSKRFIVGSLPCTRLRQRTHLRRRNSRFYRLALPSWDTTCWPTLGLGSTAPRN